MIPYSTTCRFDPDAPITPSNITFEELEWIDRVARFWKKVDVRDVSECWPWRGPKRVSGKGNPAPVTYGQWRLGDWRASSHRIAFYLACGPVPTDKLVRHKCDNGLCCNPTHLVLGDHSQNHRDMQERLRTNYTRGESHPNARLTEDDVRRIRRLYEEGRTQTSLAKEYGVPQSHVSAICLRKTWQHVD